MHIMKLTPNETVGESWFKISFLFDNLSLTSWKEIFTIQLSHAKYCFQEAFVICSLNFPNRITKWRKVISNINGCNVGYIKIL